MSITSMAGMNPKRPSYLRPCLILRENSSCQLGITMISERIHTSRRCGADSAENINPIVEALIVNFQAHAIEIAPPEPEQLMLLAS
jgi:hypothetical protein